MLPTGGRICGKLTCCLLLGCLQGGEREGVDQLREVSRKGPTTLEANQGANLKSISHRCYLREVAYEWELTKATIYLPPWLSLNPKPESSGLGGWGRWGGTLICAAGVRPGAAQRVSAPPLLYFATFASPFVHCAKPLHTFIHFPFLHFAKPFHVLQAFSFQPFLTLHFAKHFHFPLLALRSAG